MTGPPPTDNGLSTTLVGPPPTQTMVYQPQ
jgi:hypothetical protein